MRQRSPTAPQSCLAGHTPSETGLHACKTCQDQIVLLGTTARMLQRLLPNELDACRAPATQDIDCCQRYKSCNAVQESHFISSTGAKVAAPQSAANMLHMKGWKVVQGRCACVCNYKASKACTHPRQQVMLHWTKQRVVAWQTCSVTTIVRLQRVSTAAVGKGVQQRISFNIIVEKDCCEVGLVAGPLYVQCWADQARLIHRCCCCVGV